MPGAYEPARAAVPTGWTPLVPPVGRHVVMFEPDGRPTPFAGGENEHKWKQAVRDAIEAKQPFTPPRAHARLAVRVEFRLLLAHAMHEPDPDNLLKSTFDAMAGVLGIRKVQGPPQADDERIDYLEVVKREVRDGEQWGATIAVYELETTG